MEEGAIETSVQIPRIRVKTFRELRHRIPMRGVVFGECKDVIEGLSCQDQINTFVRDNPVVLVGTRIQYSQRIERSMITAVVICAVRYVEISDLVMTHFGR